MYTKITRAIRVTVNPQFLEDESKPENGRFVWVYHVEIENMSKVTVQLESRKWIITDSSGMTQEVIAEGVVGEQPILEPGDAFEYTSAVPLNTPSGIMSGFFRMVSEFDEIFDVEIPTFSLDSPFDMASIH